LSAALARFDARVAARRGACRLAGVDEVGRGCLAGPVVVAAVILPAGLRLPGVDDSKRLTRRQRETAFGVIRAAAVCWAAVAVAASEVDARNVLGATLSGMRRAVARLRVPPDLVLVDGPYLPEGLPAPGIAIVRGDGRSQAIAAASILAKVARDRLMRAWHRRYPVYGFASNVGYPTPHHLQALARAGACPLHRRSFAPVRSVCAQLPLAL
jgi:ribonuclease HII